MNIGFTFDEKVFSTIDYRSYLQRAASLGVSSIELAVDPDIMPLRDFIDIASTCSTLDMAINYHIPYFISDSYSIGNFRVNKNSSLQKYNEFFSSLESIFSVNSLKSTIVVHGEEFTSSSEKSLEGTVDFLNFLASQLQDRGLPHLISLETLRLGSIAKVGDNRADILSALNLLNSKRIGICLDICHDSMNYLPLDAPSHIDFLSRVNYAHIHGYSLSSGKNHMSISESSLNFLNQILLLNEIKPDITLNIESLSDFMGESYLHSLFKDIKLLKSIL